MDERSQTPVGARSYELKANVDPKAIVVYCSSPRFQPAFEQFIDGELHLKPGEYIPIVVAGGAGVLSQPEKLPKEFKFMKDRFEMFKEQFPNIKRIILINHEECSYYAKLREKLSFLFHAHSAAGHAVDDMKRIAEISRLLLPFFGMSLELYYARFTDEHHTKVTFERVK